VTWGPIQISGDASSDHQNESRAQAPSYGSDHGNMGLWEYGIVGPLVPTQAE